MIDHCDNCTKRHDLCKCGDLVPQLRAQLAEANKAVELHRENYMALAKQLERRLDTSAREAELLETIKNLELQIKHPLGGFCSYCGHHFEFGSEVSEEYRAKVVEHMSVCEKAPFQRIMQPLMLILDWMDVNLQEAECRGDEDCDHCHGLQLLEPFKKAFAASQAEKGNAHE